MLLLLFFSKSQHNIQHTTHNLINLHNPHQTISHSLTKQNIHQSQPLYIQIIAIHIQNPSIIIITSHSHNPIPQSQNHIAQKLKITLHTTLTHHTSLHTCPHKSLIFLKNSENPEYSTFIQCLVNVLGKDKLIKDEGNSDNPH
ncbi:hypothetical protein GPU96_06g10310 [Encephalitozoon hellem]|uniref:Uncharacterized protein n=1 Tax=Encephalitozoon hellem TaxID=27973 RepID=A0A9Q9C3M1_ENCHE|nr:hypothetical protein GPU96_04g06130 [Encephalitozoon hellem]UTX43088.1 hypothetical protein GPU96_05g08270 [Encephalitozoon hellem]UTX43285.1 hypothetical protein GPU96_06g10310 [Encephalitozoon hellem]